MRVEPFDPAHVERLSVQPHQEGWRAEIMTTDLRALATAPNRAWSVLEGEDTLACGGFVDLGQGRGRAWALLSTRPGMVALTRIVRRGIELSGFRRIDCEVAANFQPARRWAEMLGFSYEGTMRAWCYDGSDAELWAMVR